MALIDVFTFNGEYDLLEIRLNILDKYVDEFVLVECATTFSGKPKPLYFDVATHPEVYERFKKWEHKIKYHIVDENYSEEEIREARESPATQFGRGHWMTEFLQKESIKKALTHLNDHDRCFIGDVDEIWDVSALTLKQGVKLKLKVYTYWLNNRSSEQFCGTLYTTYETIKNYCLNNLRNYAHKTHEEHGWHFTSMGGYEKVKQKLTDGYTEETYANQAVMNNLQNAVVNNTDFLGRDFSYEIDESEWPLWLKENKDKYIHLCQK